MMDSSMPERRPGRPKLNLPSSVSIETFLTIIIFFYISKISNHKESFVK
jgi:hypothetical protein